MRNQRLKATGWTVMALLSGTVLHAQDLSYNLYGVPGLIDMPNARAATDAEVAASIHGFRTQQRANFTFQLLPRLSGTFRYAGIDDRGGGEEDTFDRSFDLRYQILKETDRLPAVAVGLQDFLGTGLLAGEYVVATKAITDKVDVTAGLGWGRFANRSSFDNPLGIFSSKFDTRPAIQNAARGEGGQIDAAQFFRGDAAVFGGVSYAYSDKLTVKLEYSSSVYDEASRAGILNDLSPFNVGLNYTLIPGIDLQAALLHGSEIAAGATLTLNPRLRDPVSGTETGPPPVRVRPADIRAAASWGTSEDQLRDRLKEEGFTLNGYDVSSDTVARVRYTNTTFRSEAQAMGRVARILSAELPAAVETFVLEPMQAGIPLSATTLQRSDLETYENRATGAAAIKSRSQTTAVGPATGLTHVADPEPAFQWGLGPYAALIVFNGDAPVQLDFGLDLKVEYTFTPNLFLRGNFRQSLRNSDLADEFEAEDDLQNVRTDGRLYGKDGHPVIHSLTLAHYGRSGRDLYSRVSLGYLEQQHGGLSTEVLWKPVDSRFALGAELNYTAQRDYDQLFSFQDYDVVTGSLSGYYSFANGFHGQIDVGRYLAGDYGATFTLDREFDNGWRVGAYFSLTDVPFDEFGEGSFDKGIRITVPHDFFLGKASRDQVSTTLQSLRRDGGAKLEVDGRLYNIVRDGHTAGPFGDTFGRFWR